MSVQVANAVEGEPPSTATIDDVSSAARVDRMMEIAHLPVTAHVALIGHHTLPLLLAFLRRGCAAVRSLRPGTPSPDREAADLAWIVDVRGDSELDDALHAARRCQRWSLPFLARSIRDRAVAVGLDVISFDHNARRLVLAVPAAR